ncbi:hypothetical protein L7F22_056725 [Adiantum nelumboides]|nr:hypothetical protein [Adiantum nelumboides]
MYNSGHLNEFNSLFIQLTSQGFSEFDDELKAIFLLCSLPNSWDIFCTAISNSAPNGRLVINDVTNALLTEEIRCKSLDGASHGDGYMASSSHKHRDREKDEHKGKGREQNNCNQSRNRNSSKERSARNVECYHCHKKGHYKKDCRSFLREQKTMQKDNSDKGKSTVKIEETQYDVLIFTSDLSPDALVAQDEDYAQNWIIDFGANFHVTPHRDWFTSYAPMQGIVKLGDSYEVEIIGSGGVKFQMRNGTTFVLQNVRRAKDYQELFFVGQLDDLGYTIVFGNGSWMYGFQPRSIVIVGLATEKLQHVNDFLQDHMDMLKLTRQNVCQAQDRYKKYADEKC